MKKLTVFLLLALVMSLVVSVNAQSAQSYLLISSGRFPSNINAQISRAGGTITNRINEAGIIVVSSANPNFRTSISGVMAVVPNVVIDMTPDMERIAAEPNYGNPPNSGDDDARFNLQWGHDAVNAPEAWNAGVRGDGAVVAVLDGGFNPSHVDIAPNFIHGADMTGEGLLYENVVGCTDPADNDPAGIFSHGMHVAGTIAAADNAAGTIGVAPEAKLVLVKVLGNCGSGSFEDVIEGIIYAANYNDEVYGGVDIINMSLGADIPQGLGIGSNEVAALRAAMNRAVTYAYQQGIAVFVAAGNDGRDLDKDQSTTVFPAQMANAIAISATGPEGWAVDSSTDLDTLAIYSNYGRSGIDFAAPGGDYEFALTSAAAFGNCTVGGITRVCYVFDYVFSTGGANGGANYYYWSVGTSMATPHAAGVAALIVGEFGGEMHPAQLKAEMASRSDDLGQPGNDPVYGAGRLSSGY
jgi:subtilisin family serine protease